MTRIFVIPGHGAGDSGAVGNGYQEQERVRALAKRIKALGGDSVTLADFSRNYYADNGISSLSLPSDTQIIELHMDSATASARGGHVIIYSGFEPDEYDEALADFIGSFMPGRSVLISKRSDLANPKRAAAKGYGYRLMECGFITNASDVAKFNSKMDDLARGILKAFGISSSGSSGSSGSSVDLDALAHAVIRGDYGNGEARKKALGSNYEAVQKRVNELLGAGSSGSSVDLDALARAVIRGDYGNGEARKKALGSNYEAVQKRVNELLS